ncbi:MAG: acetylornithine/succinylornithine family transaminase [Opitutales bacterium]
MTQETDHLESLEARYERFLLQNYPKAPLNLVKGEGVFVWDDVGKRYMDFTSGIGVNALGHCHPEWVRRLSEQAGRLVHVSNLFRNENQALLAERLVQKAGAGKVFFCNSGAEAHEALLKLSRLHGKHESGKDEKRTRILAAQNSFHGRTFGGMSATPQQKIRNGFGPFLPGFAFGELNNVESFSRLVDDETAAIFLETIQGEGGIHPCTAEFLTGIRQLCDDHGILMVLDEVQCGIGRTGRFYAFEEAGIRPDAIAMAKGLGGGIPIGAIWVRDRFSGLFTPGSHGTTFGGTPLACAAALATLDVIEKEELVKKVRVFGGKWLKALEGLRGEFAERMLAVRGRGYMVGVQLAGDPLPVIARMRKDGLLAAAAGGNVVRFLPPLIASEEDLETSVAIFRRALATD